MAKSPSGGPRSSRAPASRSAGSVRPRAGTAGRATGIRSLRAGTGRPLWVLGAVGVVLALLILPYFQKWLVQRSEIESARADVASVQQDVAALQAQKQRWSDEDYVRAQARARLNYVMPGETGYVVVPAKPAAKSSSAGAPAAAASVPAGQRPWFGNLWLSTQAAAAAK